jgi:hypothetical protein
VSDEAFKARAAGRRNWPVSRYRLGEEPADGVPEVSSVEARIAMMWPLALDAWSSTGRELPAYERSAMPGCVTRRSRGGRTDAE